MISRSLRILVLGVLFALPAMMIGAFLGSVTRNVELAIIGTFLGAIIGFTYGVNEGREAR